MLISKAAFHKTLHPLTNVQFAARQVLVIRDNCRSQFNGQHTIAIIVRITTCLKGLVICHLLCALAIKEGDLSFTIAKTFLDAGSINLKKSAFVLGKIR